MSCKIVRLANGFTAIVKVAPERARKCSVCRRLAKEFVLCDFPAGGSKTCSAVLCKACATHKEPDTDYCPAHAAMFTPEGRLRL